MKHFKYRFGLTPMFVGTLWLFDGQPVEQKRKLDSLKDISGISREPSGLAERLIFSILFAVSRPLRKRKD
jgi:hypothetical protein